MLKVCTTASLSEDAAIHASNGSEFGQLLKRGIHSPEASATVGFWICCTLLYSHNSLVVQGPGHRPEAFHSECEFIVSCGSEPEPDVITQNSLIILVY